MKIKWKSALSRWPAFFLIAAVSSFLLCWGVSVSCKPKKNERLYYLVLTYGVSADSLVNKSKEVTTGIREVKIHYQSLEQSDDAKKLFTYVYDSCDFYIVPESWMSLASGYSYKFDEATIHDAVPSSANYSLYSFEGKYTGIKLYDKSEGIKAAGEYFTYEKEEKEKENFYMCFPSSSVHAGKLGNCELDNALKVAEALL